VIRLSQPQLTRQTCDPSHDQYSLIRKRTKKIIKSIFLKKSYDEIEKENKSKEKGKQCQSR
jgi:hypothetical protein